MSWNISFNREGPYRWDNRQRLWLFKYSCTSDASASGNRVLIDDINSVYGAQKGQPIIKSMKGGMLQGVVYIPDATDTPTTAAVITLSQEDGVNFFNETVTTANTGQVFSGMVDTNFALPFTNLTFASTTLADTKKAVFKIWVVR